MRAARISPCRHCARPPARGPSPGRGLCWTCYRDPAVRVAYPRYKPGPRTGGLDEIAERDDTEPTAEEVERTVAEQMTCLPDWWEAECERERCREYARKVYVLVKCA